MASTAEDVSIVPSHAENNDAGVTTLAPSPNDLQMLPELTATRLGAANRVSVNAGSNLQEMMFATSDRHIMPVMFDEYAHDDFSTTSTEWFGSDNLAAPFSVDISNMNGLGALPWSPPKTTYSESTFDIPYAIEHTTDASANLPSTSQFELNLSLSPTGPMRDIYDEKMWEEVSPKVSFDPEAIRCTFSESDCMNTRWANTVFVDCSEESSRDGTCYSDSKTITNGVRIQTIAQELTSLSRQFSRHSVNSSEI
jgi:hypothetical protein